MRTVKAGLIQASLPFRLDESSPQVCRQAMIDKHLPLIAQAAGQGIQILCLQELFYGPYFCPSQSETWFALAEKIPEGPTTQLMIELAKQHNMVLVVPIDKEESPGFDYTTAAVIDADGTYVGKYRKTHLPQMLTCASSGNSTEIVAPTCTRIWSCPE